MLISYAKVCRDTAPGTDCSMPSGKPLGAGVVALHGGSGKVTRHPALTFGPESEYSLDVVAAGYVYGYRCVDGQEKSFTGRTTPAHPEKPSVWRYFDGRHWSADQGGARATGPQCGSGHTVQWVPKLHAYLNTFLPALGNTVMYQVGASPFGPWSAARPLAETLPTAARVNYALTQYLTYHHPDDDRQHVLKVVLENTS